MKRYIAALTVAATLLLAAGITPAQQGDPQKKTDPDPQKKQDEKKEGGLPDLQQIMKLFEQIGASGGQIDPEQLKKMMEQFTGKGGVLDPEQLKKMMENIGAKASAFDPSQLKKLVDKAIGKGAKDTPLDVDQIAVQRFKTLDKNADGVLNEDEMPKSLRAVYKTYATDGGNKGTIDLEGYRAYMRDVLGTVEALDPSKIADKKGPGKRLR